MARASVGMSMSIVWYTSAMTSPGWLLIVINWHANSTDNASLWIFSNLLYPKPNAFRMNPWMNASPLIWINDLGYSEATKVDRRGRASLIKSSHMSYSLKNSYEGRNMSQRLIIKHSMKVWTGVYLRVEIMLSLICNSRNLR